MTNTGKPDCFTRPSLYEVAKAGSEFSLQTWVDMNKPSRDVKPVSFLAEKILAILLIRIIALLSSRDMTPSLPIFQDLSTSTICHTILSQNVYHESSSCHHINHKKEDFLPGEEKERDNNEESENENESESESECDEDFGRLELQWPKIITEEIVAQLYEYIHKILDMYRSVSYHNREHACHVFISAHKLLDMVLCEYDYSNQISSSPIRKKLRPTYGLKSDPLLQLAFLFSALVHDVDHTGVSNRQLVLESDELAIMYNDQSVAEQRSLAIAFSLLMKNDYKPLRDLIFHDDDYQRFRKVVIDLVLCTDIASPERVQIVKSKWKEAFGDKNRPSSIGHRLVAQQSSHSFSDHSTINGQGKEDQPKRRTSTLLPPTDDLADLDDIEDAPERPPDFKPREVFLEKKKSLTFSEKKIKNAWKSKPADPSTGKATLFRQFIKTRGSLTMLLGFKSSKNNDGGVDDSVSSRQDGSSHNHGNSCHDDSDTKGKKNGKKRFVHSLRQTFKMKKKPSLKNGKDCSKAEVKQEREVDFAPPKQVKTQQKPDLVSQPVTATKSMGDLTLSSSGMKGILDEYEDDDLSFSSEFSDGTSVYTSNHGEGELGNVHRKRYYQTKNAKSTDFRRSDITFDKPRQSYYTHEQFRRRVSAKRPDIRRESSSKSSGTTKSNEGKPRATRRQSRNKKMRRRFTEPPNSLLSNRKKFHFRLGIRRALDLTGNQIDAYERVSKRMSENDPDRPDALKVIVVLEQLIKAADVAANMQAWDTMVAWCKRLFQEQKVRTASLLKHLPFYIFFLMFIHQACFVEGRGEDPITEWHENQIAFFESYTMPLACKLVETGVFEFEASQELVNGVRQNNIRWMIEGMDVIEKMVMEWERLQEGKSPCRSSTLP